MKKLLLIFVFCCFGWQYNAFAECQLLSCDSFSWYEFNVSLRAGVDSNQCYGCGLGPRSCGNGDVVPYLDTNGEILDVYQCTFGLEASFENANPGNLCSDSPIENTSATNSKTIYKPVGSKTTSFQVGDFTVFSGTAFCKYIYCLDGYTPNPDKTKCVDIKPIAVCSSTGGIWNFDTNKCICDVAKNLKDGEGENEGKCICISDDYEFDASSGQCKKKQSVIDEENRQRQNEENRRRQNQQRKTACENSGGVWTNNQCTCDREKNLLTENNVCVCLDGTNYRRQGKKCILTDAAALQRECDSEVSRASGAYWDAANKQCLCENPQHVWRGGNCEMNPAITQCMHITGANWNNTTKQCYCIQKGYEINATYTACEQTEESRREQQDAEREQAAAASRRRIEGAISDIESIVSTLDRSKWKNAEGGFNTSRLLSDSIAGVVLGTAGGLITSHVVKKNQVEGGFEDIQCTVGGQVVSGWGDEFQVGIQ